MSAATALTKLIEPGGGARRGDERDDRRRRLARHGADREAHTAEGGARLARARGDVPEELRPRRRAERLVEEELARAIDREDLGGGAARRAADELGAVLLRRRPEARREGDGERVGAEGGGLVRLALQLDDADERDERDRRHAEDDDDGRRDGQERERAARQPQTRKIGHVRRYPSAARPARRPSCWWTPMSTSRSLRRRRPVCTIDWHGGRGAGSPRAGCFPSSPSRRAEEST